MGKQSKGGKAAAQPPDLQKSPLKKEGAKAKSTKLLQQGEGKGSRQGVAALAAAATPPQAGAAPPQAAATAAGAEIDELFGKLKGKKKAAAPKEEAAVAAAAASTAADKDRGKDREKAKKVEGSKHDIFGTEAALARK
jgi:hypothetical protein